MSNTNENSRNIRTRRENIASILNQLAKTNSYSSPKTDNRSLGDYVNMMLTPNKYTGGSSYVPSDYGSSHNNNNNVSQQLFSQNTVYLTSNFSNSDN